MIARPTVQRLLALHGYDAAGRRAARHDMMQHLYREAMREAATNVRTAGMSLLCMQPAPHACKSDGSGCLCWCHDPAESTRESEAA